MCSGGCAKCLGIALIPLAILCILANILLFFPGGKVAESNEHISNEVWYFGGILGSGVLMVFPALVFLGLKNNDCCGCCGNEKCGKRFAMFSSILFAAIGFVGAGYSFIISIVGIHNGPKCDIGSGNWTYAFNGGNYLGHPNIWSTCEAPKDIVPWNLTLFSLLLIMSAVQAVLCAIQAINGLIGTFCGDCKCSSCCGPVFAWCDMTSFEKTLVTFVTIPDIFFKAAHLAPFFSGYRETREKVKDTSV